jgi:hypothetical protein
VRACVCWVGLTRRLGECLSVCITYTYVCVYVCVCMCVCVCTSSAHHHIHTYMYITDRPRRLTYDSASIYIHICPERLYSSAVAYEDMPEARTPRLLRSRLHPHQVSWGKKEEGRKKQHSARAALREGMK